MRWWYGVRVRRVDAHGLAGDLGDRPARLDQLVEDPGRPALVSREVAILELRVQRGRPVSCARHEGASSVWMTPP